MPSTAARARGGPAAGGVSLDQLSAHVVAEALVHDAEARGLVLAAADGRPRAPGRGDRGHGRGPPRRRWDQRGLAARARRGRGAPCRARRPAARRSSSPSTASRRARSCWPTACAPTPAAAIAALRAAGVARIAMVTGDDRRDRPARSPRALGLDDVFAERSARGQARGRAPLRRPTRRRGPWSWSATASTTPRRSPPPTSASRWRAAARPCPTEAADAVITVDRLDRLADAVQIGRRSLLIARQSVLAGWA